MSAQFLLLVGTLAALLTALGKKRWAWGIPMLLLGPLVALPFSFVDPDARYARSLLLGGVGAGALAIIVLYSAS